MLEWSKKFWCGAGIPVFRILKYSNISSWGHNRKIYVIAIMLFSSVILYLGKKSSFIVTPAAWGARWQALWRSNVNEVDQEYTSRSFPLPPTPLQILLEECLEIKLCLLRLLLGVLRSNICHVMCVNYHSWHFSMYQ